MASRQPPSAGARPRLRWRRRALPWAGVAVAIAAIVAVVAAVAPGSPSSYPWHPGTTASVFGPHEDANASNAFISNAQSAWDKDWRRHAPRENPFFVAVPYADYLDDGRFNPDNVRIPWHVRNVWGRSEIKNRWVEVTHRSGGRTFRAYGQVEDVGPSDKRTSVEVSDPDYVFGPRGHGPSDPILVSPKNTFGLRAGIDLSRRLARTLRIQGSGKVDWRFVDASDVPQGPWTEVVTASAPNW